jgi:ubiquinone/menaquinone biosynthesis C-methylase UbiE
LDNSSGLIEICKEKYPKIAERFAVGDMLKLPYNDNFFDSIMSIAAFHHLPTRELRIKALREMYRVLKPGGYLLMTNWHLWHQPYFKHWFNCFWQKLSWKDFFVPWKGPDGKIKCQRYYHAFTKRELNNPLAQAGFKTEKIFLDIKPDAPNYGRRVNLVSIAKKPL